MKGKIVLYEGSEEDLKVLKVGVIGVFETRSTNSIYPLIYAT
jgi:hypothetical protein